MNAFKTKSGAKTGKNANSVSKTKSSPHKWGASPFSKGGLNPFYSAGPVLTLGSAVQAKTITPQPVDPAGQGAENHVEKCAGTPLPRATGNFFARRLGRDFSAVRIHTCSTAVQMNRQLKARAFTYGNNIFFNRGGYNPGTVSGKRLLAHELTHVVQQKSGPMRIQPARVTDPVVGCYRDNAQACLVHLHGSEKTALKVGKELYCNYCVNLVYIDHAGRRPIRIRVPYKGKRYTGAADPNRIFSDTKISPVFSQEALKDLEQKDKRRIRQRAKRAVIDFRDQKLLPEIDTCRGITGKEGEKSMPVVALHNNRTALSIESYLPKGSENSGTKRATAMPDKTEDHTMLKSAYNDLFPKNQPANIGAAYRNEKAPWDFQKLNPHIQQAQQGKATPNPHDFFLVTQWTDFVPFVRKGFNVVLQSKHATDDGSLSIKLKKERYINIEARRAWWGGGAPPQSERTENEAFRFQKGMATTAVKDVLGVDRISKGNCPPKAANKGCPACANDQAGTGEVKQEVK